MWTAVGMLATKTGFILSGMLSILGVFLKVSLFVFQQFLQLQAPICHAWWWAQWQNVLQVRALQNISHCYPIFCKLQHSKEKQLVCVCVCACVCVFLCNLLYWQTWCVCVHVCMHVCVVYIISVSSRSCLPLSGSVYVLIISKFLLN